MNHRYFGTTGIKVSPLCFGTMSFGGDASPEVSRQLYDRCREAGLNFFDCADVYASGRSEELLGEFIAPERDQVIITSKAFFPTDKSDPNARGASRRHLHLACEASLKRLGTEYIDVYFIHRFDEQTDLHESLRALDDLVSQGKALYLGASNFAAWQVTKALGLADREGWSKFCCIQPMYNLVKRIAEIELLPMATSENLAVLPYSPLGGGLLTGKYATGENKGRLVENSMYEKRYGDPSVHEVARNFADFARARDYSPASLAVAWVGAHESVTAPIIGARNLEQLEDSLTSMDIEMTPSLYGEIAALSPAPPPATDRNEERESGDPMAVVVKSARF
ncbi:MAG: aldo/keto reductase [Planctomycetota bacterium]|nr:aldo/keto reductase [Planctomycetota bacterium]